MKNCPMCGATVEARFPFLLHLEKRGLYCFSHYCERTEDYVQLTIDVYGKTKEEVIERWNRRAEDAEKHIADQ